MNENTFDWISVSKHGLLSKRLLTEKSNFVLKVLIFGSQKPEAELGQGLQTAREGEGAARGGRQTILSVFHPTP